MSTQQAVKDVEDLAQAIEALHLDLSKKERVRVATPCMGSIRDLVESDIGYIICGSEHFLQCMELRRLDSDQLDEVCQFAWTGQTAADLEFWDLRLLENVQVFNNSGKWQDITRLESMLKIFKDSPLGPGCPGPYRVPETNVYLDYLFYEDYLEHEDYTEQELERAIKAPYPALYEFVEGIRQQNETYRSTSKPDHHPSNSQVQGVGKFDAVAVWVDHNYNDVVFRNRYDAPDGVRAAVLAKHIKLPSPTTNTPENDTNSSENDPAVLPKKTTLPLEKWKPMKLYRFNEVHVCNQYTLQQIEEKKKKKEQTV